MSFSLAILCNFIVCDVNRNEDVTWQCDCVLTARATYGTTDMLATILVTWFVVTTTVTGHANFRSQLWVTKILSDALDGYVPDGGPACRRHGLEYRDGQSDLKLWATRSKIITINRN